MSRSRFSTAVAVLMLAVAAIPALAELEGAEWTRVASRAEAAARRGDDREAGAALLEVAKDDSERAVKLLASVYARFPGYNDALFDDVYRAVEGMRGPGAVAELRKQLTTAKDWRFRVVIVDVLGARGCSEQDALFAALEDRREEVVRAATRNLARLRTEAGIRAICAAMEKLEAKGKTTATWQDMRNALMRALGVDLQGGADYRNYLDANRARFVEGRGIPADSSAARAKGGEGRIGETVVFGTELYCKNVVLILDRSGSMDITDPYPPGMDLGSRPREYVASNGMTDPDRNRMVRARKELVKLLDDLARVKGKVNIIAYSSNVSVWREAGGLHALDSSSLRSAKAFVEDLKAEGVTVTDVALATAFEIAPEADCFYLISDGKATHDGHTFIPAPEILSEVERSNRLRKVQICTFGFVPPRGAEAADVPLMTGLAEQTGGIYTEIK